MKKIFLSILMLTLVGCGSTPYQASKGAFNEGYAETQLSQNIWQVYFEGNGDTTRQQAEDFCMLRGAELADKNGYPYFTVADKRDDVATLTQSTPFIVHFFGNYANATGGQVYSVDKPISVKTIIGFKNKEEAKDGIVFESEFIIKSIAEKYKIEFLD
jgi:hypothetical protein